MYYDLNFVFNAMCSLVNTNYVIFLKIINNDNDFKVVDRK